MTARWKDAALRGRGRHWVEVGVSGEAEARSYLEAVLDDQPQVRQKCDDLSRDLGFLPLALAAMSWLP
ncbi:hypothetical protein [Amycolatopsis panacis]|uniref:hypothetical protein n=1 Tax=Amycolatopsis panacis TaxID=2340917 RepID=UPI0011C449B2|nr:hypothetical protein [Amycolatopsis panacis]